MDTDRRASIHNDSVSAPSNKPTFVPPPTPLLKKIGYGTGVSVYHLDRSPLNNTAQSPWALKKANKQQATLHFQDRIEKEAEILKELKHPNIVGFRGISKTSDGRKVLAMEECHQSLGDLIIAYLESCEERFTPEEILKVVVGVAKALQYLHEEKGLLHGDIKSHNVLINNHFEEIKLCDFGVSLKLSSATVDNYVGSGPWTAPEALMDGPITEKTDIFSFGLIIWEMLTLKTPNITEIPNQSTNSLLSEDEEMIDCEYEEHYGESPVLPEGLSSDYDLVTKLCEWCTRQEHEERPRARDILRCLSENGISINSSPPLITL